MDGWMDGKAEGGYKARGLLSAMKLWGALLGNQAPSEPRQQRTLASAYQLAVTCQRYLDACWIM